MTSFDRANYTNDRIDELKQSKRDLQFEIYQLQNQLDLIETEIDKEYNEIQKDVENEN